MLYAITLGTGGDALALATADDTVEALLLDGQSVGDVQRLFHAAAVRPVNRGNRARSLTFTVKRKPLGTPVLAAKALFVHELALETKLGPSLTLSFGAVGAGFTLLFANAVLTHRGRAPGTTSIHDYAITAGSYTVTDL